MPIDKVLIEEVASQQQTLAVAKRPLQSVTATCKHCEVMFVLSKDEQRFFQRKRMANPARCPEAGNRFVKSERKQPAKIDSRIVSLGLNSKLQ